MKKRVQQETEKVKGNWIGTPVKLGRRCEGMKRKKDLVKETYRRCMSVAITTRSRRFCPKKAQRRERFLLNLLVPAVTAWVDRRGGKRAATEEESALMGKKKDSELLK